MHFRIQGQLHLPRKNRSHPDRPKVVRIPDGHWYELSGMHLTFEVGARIIALQLDGGCHQRGDTVGIQS